MTISAYTVHVNTGTRRYEYITMVQHGADAIVAAIERFGICAVSVCRLVVTHHAPILAA
ncbi:MAG: hypothetical protein ACRYGK_15760 [Janthinobacterium lividum]